MSANPEFVYRIITVADWAIARTSGVVSYGAVDQRDGFLHLSMHAQILETARRHYQDKGALLALEIPLAAIAHDVKFETAPKRGEKFPHLYSDLKVSDVARAIPLEPDGDDFYFEDQT